MQVTQDEGIAVKRSDKMWSMGGENGNPHQYSCLENPMSSMKRQKDTTLEDEPPGQKESRVLLGSSKGNY